MEMLQALEQKLESLVELIKKQKLEIANLEHENRELQAKIGQLESALLSEAKRVDSELKQERSAAQQAVDELIKSIDDLIESGGAQ